MGLEDERLFLRVVEAGSLKAAAERLGVDASTVSRRLVALEARLGVTLLQRSSRQASTPTDAGARYAAGLRQLIAQHDALTAEVTGTALEPQGLLCVSAPVDFGGRFVVPIADRLQRQAPHLEIELRLSNHFVDLEPEGIDIAVRIGTLPDSPLVARRLGAVPRVLVAAPDYLARRGTPQHPADLRGHDFIYYHRTARPSIAVTPPGAASPIEVPTQGRLSVNSVSGVRALALAGHGLTLGPRWAYAADLEAGRLVSVLPDHGLRAYPLHALYRPTPYVPARIRSFIDLLAAHLDPAVTATR